MHPVAAISQCIALHYYSWQTISGEGIINKGDIRHGNIVSENEVRALLTKLQPNVESWNPKFKNKMEIGSWTILPIEIIL